MVTRGRYFQEQTVPCVDPGPDLLVRRAGRQHVLQEVTVTLDPLEIFRLFWNISSPARMCPFPQH